MGGDYSSSAPPNVGNHFIFEATFLTVSWDGWTRPWNHRILENDWWAKPTPSYNRWVNWGWFHIISMFLELNWVSGEVLDARDKQVSKKIHSPFPQGAYSTGLGGGGGWARERHWLNNHMYESLPQAELCEKELSILRTHFRQTWPSDVSPVGKFF